MGRQVDSVLINTSGTIVISGGGNAGGLIAASESRKRLPRRHCAVLVGRKREQLFAPRLQWLMVGLRDGTSIQRPLKRIERRGTEVRLGEVEKIAPETRRGRYRAKPWMQWWTS